MDIIVVSNFCAELTERSNGRFQYLCNRLVPGNDVELIISDFNHMRKDHNIQIANGLDFSVTVLHEGGYNKNICVQRLISHKKWGWKVKKYLKNRKRPDVLYCAVPPLSGALEIAKYCKKEKVRFIIDIQDLWPEAFRLAFQLPVLSQLIFSPFKHIANKIYKNADAICGVSETYVNRAQSVNKKNASGHVVYLGTQLSTFDFNAKNNIIDKPENELWLVYCGTLGASYDITVVIDALKILKNQGIEPPKFIVLGDGERRDEFRHRAEELGIDCMFTGRLPYDQMCGWLDKCDIAANPIMHNAAQSIINKHGDYCAASLPVINTQECKEYRDLVEKYQMGLNVLNNDPVDFAEKLIVLVKDKEKRNLMAKNARRCAEELFDRKYSYQELIDVILEE